MRLSFQERGEQVVEELEAGVRSSEYKMKQISTNNVHHINSAIKQQSEYTWFSEMPVLCMVIGVKSCVSSADNLQKRGWPNTPICQLCQVEQETCFHLLVTCTYFQQVWQLVLKKLESTVALPPADAVNLLDCRNMSQTEWSITLWA